jgi:hypothetical protein
LIAVEVAVNPKNLCDSEHYGKSDHKFEATRKSEKSEKSVVVIEQKSRSVSREKLNVHSSMGGDTGSFKILVR